MTTNEFERDLDDQAGLKRPGRIDMRVFQNTADAGDGHPGVQRCFRNYLHEGGMEKDIQLLGFGIVGTSVNINNAELQQLSNIGSSVITNSIWSQLDNIEATTISPTQWGYVGGADQPVKQADSPTFNGLTLSSLTVNGSITITGNVDSVDVSDLKSAFDTHKASTGVDHSYINQDLKTTFSPTFVGLTLSADLVTTSTVDGVDVSGHVHSGAGQGGTVDHVSLSNKGSNAHSVIDTHLGSTSNPHTVTLDQAFDASKIIDGANSLVNAFVVGNGTDYLKTYVISTSLLMVSANGMGLQTTEDYGHISINPQGVGAEVVINPGDVGSWTFLGRDLTPYASNVSDIGNDAAELADIWYCTVHDTTCADFSHYTIDELYNLFEQIKPMTDGGLHYNKHNKQSFPHIDLQTLPVEFAEPASKDMTKNNVWELDKDNKIVFRETDYKKGDSIGIDMGTFLYALKSFVVKQHEEIMYLKKELSKL